MLNKLEKGKCLQKEEEEERSCYRSSMWNTKMRKLNFELKPTPER